MNHGYYSLIQYCPDRSRAEVVNIGVLLYCPSEKFLDSMFTGNERAIAFFGADSCDWDRLIVRKMWMKVRLRFSAFPRREELEQFIATRANEIILTPLRPMVVDDPLKDLLGLYRELVHA